MPVRPVWHFLCAGFSVLIIGLLLSSCKRDTDFIAPTLQFVSGEGFISSDTVLKPGERFLVGIIAEMGSDDLTNFHVKRTFPGGEEVIIDTGIHNKKFIYSTYLSKGVRPTETWHFRILDQLGVWTQRSFTLRNDPFAFYDPVRYIPSLTLGAQQNTSTGSFYGLQNDSIYFQAQAYLEQDSIDMLYYYNTLLSYEHSTISSPGANIDTVFFPGPTGIFYWPVRNTTRYYKTYLSGAAFDNITNDSLLIASFNQLHSKRKAKSLVPGDTYSFQTKEGKFGLFRVLSVTGSVSGNIEIAIKVQQ
jgi:hypothetical protein